MATFDLHGNVGANDALNLLLLARGIHGAERNHFTLDPETPLQSLRPG